eukprot:TRINITY_DN120773_c0_g1_i1.p1 TRINITY_DN120773_c0_g1~~TRINITY_DN120773_c0_g1_i1.p1  ORF type:complete len:697 (-),score=200.47 TRINITY_DN120773_c0_g1_i1:183-2273(-)
MAAEAKETDPDLSPQVSGVVRAAAGAGIVEGVVPPTAEDADAPSAGGAALEQGFSMGGSEVEVAAKHPFRQFSAAGSPSMPGSEAELPHSAAAQGEQRAPTARATDELPPVVPLRRFPGDGRLEADSDVVQRLEHLVHQAHSMCNRLWSKFADVEAEVQQAQKMASDALNVSEVKDALSAVAARLAAAEDGQQELTTWRSTVEERFRSCIEEDDRLEKLAASLAASGLEAAEARQAAFEDRLLKGITEPVEQLKGELEGKVQDVDSSVAQRFEAMQAQITSAEDARSVFENHLMTAIKAPVAEAQQEMHAELESFREACTAKHDSLAAQLRSLDEWKADTENRVFKELAAATELAKTELTGKLSQAESRLLDMLAQAELKAASDLATSSMKCGTDIKQLSAKEEQLEAELQRLATTQVEAKTSLQHELDRQLGDSTQEFERLRDVLGKQSRDHASAHQDLLNDIAACRQASEANARRVSEQLDTVLMASEKRLERSLERGLVDERVCREAAAAEDSRWRSALEAAVRQGFEDVHSSVEQVGSKVKQLALEAADRIHEERLRSTSSQEVVEKRLDAVIEPRIASAERVATAHSQVLEAHSARLGALATMLSTDVPQQLEARIEEARLNAKEDLAATALAAFESEMRLWARWTKEAQQTGAAAQQCGAPPVAWAGFAMPPSWPGIAAEAPPPDRVLAK